MRSACWTADGLDLAALFARHAERPAILQGDGCLSWGTVGRRVAGAAAGLRALGIREGRRVGFWAENRPAHFITLLACWACGAVFVPLNWKAPPAAVSQGLPLDLLVTEGRGEPAVAERTVPLSVLSDCHPAAGRRRPLPLVPLEREAAIIFTSGSSGPPKGVVHTVASFLYSADGTARFYGLEPRDTWLVSLPLFHVGGLLVFVRCLLAGAAAVFPPSLAAIGAALVSRRPTFLSLVPTQLLRLLDDPLAVSALRGCRAVLVGGAAPAADLMNRCRDLGIPVSPTYGASETCAQVTAVAPDAPREDLASAGRPLPHRRVRLGSGGRIAVGGRTLLSHYVTADGVTRPVENGWLQTPDTGRWDGRGNLVVLGRSDLIFQAGGENINPEEIEDHLLALPQVLAAVVVPVPDPEFGHVPWALVATSGPLDGAGLAAALRKKLAGFKVPKRFLPLAAAGCEADAKPDRSALGRWAERTAATDGSRSDNP
ncbi:MAG: AMP-binding protein [Desulfobacteraceae bacterium]